MGIPLEVWNPKADRSQYYRWSGIRPDSWWAAHRYWLDQVATAVQAWAAQRGIRLPADPEAALARLAHWSPEQLSGLALPLKPLELLYLEQCGDAPGPRVVQQQPDEAAIPVRTSLEAWLALAGRPVLLQLDQALAWHRLVQLWEDQLHWWEGELAHLMTNYLQQVRREGHQGRLPAALRCWPNPRTRGSYLRATACRQAAEQGVVLPAPPAQLLLWEPLVQQARGELWMAYLPLAVRAVLTRVQGQLEGEAVLDLLIEAVEALGTALGRYDPSYGYTPAFFLEAQVLPLVVERSLARRTTLLLSRHSQEALRRLRAARLAASAQGLPATVAQWASLAGLEVEEAIQLLAAEQPPLALTQCVGGLEPTATAADEDWSLVAEVLEALPVEQRILLEEATLPNWTEPSAEALGQAQAQFVTLLRQLAPHWVAWLEGGQ